jgi:L-alanine-DL-glutamate epimerase-like enolase superfamily enzyme
MKLRLFEYILPLKHVFTISRGSISEQPTLIVELEEDGVRGYGEATANDFYGASIQNMAAALTAIKPQIEQHQLDNPEAFWDEMHPHLVDNPFAHCALDQAAHDLWGKKLGQPVYKLWGLSPDNMPLTSFTIAIDEIDVMVAKMKEQPDWPIYKIKLGTAHDLDIVRELRKHTGAVFRVDANCGWTAEETIENSNALRDLNVEFIEQPLPREQWSEMKTAFATSALPVIADESCALPADVEKCADCFHGINIKLVKCGGLVPARRMIERARELELKTMVGCMTESNVGISAIAQLLPLLDYVDMDGALLLAEDIASGVTIELGECAYSPEPGNGVQLIKLAKKTLT